MPTPRIQPEIAAYFAGLFDGEGCIRIEIKEGKRGGTGVLYVSLGSTDLRVTAEMKQLFGGYLTSVRKASKHARMASRDWKATNGVASEFLAVIYPYLRIKKRQAALAFKFRKMMDQSLWSRDAHRINLLRTLVSEITALKHGLGFVETVKLTPETVNSQSNLPLN